MYMNTKRQNKRKKRQSKKVKRKTKTYKKRSIRKYGGNWFDNSHYLYSAMFHGLEKRPVYKFNVTELVGEGSFATAYLGKIQCDPENIKRVCIKEYGSIVTNSASSDNIIPMFSQTLQNMKNGYAAEGQEKPSFPFSKEYMLRIYGKTDQLWKNKNIQITKREFRGTELHKTLSEQCSKYVCKLFDYGTILKKNYIRRLIGQKYQEKANTHETCKQDHCLYALLEKGKEDMEYYCRNRLRGFTLIIKNLYVIAMKMIRNIYCLHSKNIMHYDIKLGNCVFFPINAESDEISLEEIEKICNLNEEFINDVKLIDFGFAEQLNPNDYNTERRGFGSYGLRYYSHCDKLIFTHSRFPDIYAILYDITEMMDESGKSSDVNTRSSLYAARTESHIFNIKIKTKIQINGEKFGCPDDLPPYLKEQVKLLEQPEFNREPYQNILTKLKEEYNVLNRPR